MQNDIHLVLAGIIGFIGFVCCLSLGGAILGVPLLVLGALVAFSRGN